MAAVVAHRARAPILAHIIRNTFEFLCTHTYPHAHAQTPRWVPHSVAGVCSCRLGTTIMSRTFCLRALCETPACGTENARSRTTSSSNLIEMNIRTWAYALRRVLPSQFWEYYSPKKICQKYGRVSYIEEQLCSTKFMSGTYWHKNTTEMQKYLFLEKKRWVTKID